ncbi:MAG: hypothetical protein WCI18_07890 [Pseudomonadota bacterium]
MKKNAASPIFVSGCRHCLGDKKVRFRSFSDKAWSYLFVAGEVDFEAIGNPLCDSCYNDLREVLIDSHVEVEATVIPVKIAERVKSLSES